MQGTSHNTLLDSPFANNDSSKSVQLTLTQLEAENVHNNGWSNSGQMLLEEYAHRLKKQMNFMIVRTRYYRLFYYLILGATILGTATSSVIQTLSDGSSTM